MLVLRKILVALLTLLAHGVLKRHQPRIVVVTGSVGKTSTKELAAAMLATRYQVRKAEGNYNTEVGVPLTILGERLPKSPFGWPLVLLRGLFRVASTSEYPEILVLEFAADKPGDLKHLTKLCRPDVAVVTNVRNVHREFYKSLGEIADEKAWVVRRLKPSGTAILNLDDPRTREMGSLTTARIRFFGAGPDAHLRLRNVEHQRAGYRATIDVSGTELPVQTNLHGAAQLNTVLAALGVADALEVPLTDALKAAAGWTPPAGRLRMFAGKDGRTILDDTYNASPEATIASLEALQAFPAPRRVVLGDMKELGAASVAGHKEVGRAAAKLVDELVVVGEEAPLIAEAAKEARLASGSIHFAGNATEAVKIVSRMGKGGSLLVKGSQSMYLEQVVSALLKNPQDQKRLLQRLRDPWHAKQAGVTGWGAKR